MCGERSKYLGRVEIRGEIPDSGRAGLHAWIGARTRRLPLDALNKDELDSMHCLSMGI
jgi:hypothetical protein